MIIEPVEVQFAPQACRFTGAEVTEQIHYEAARFGRRRHRKDKDQPPVIAALSGKLRERCVAAPGLRTQIIVGKCCDHLPLYRQEQIYWTRHRVDLPRHTIATWMRLILDWSSHSIRKSAPELSLEAMSEGGYAERSSKKEAPAKQSMAGRSAVF